MADRPLLKRLTITFGSGAMGGCLFLMLGLPAPLLSGPMVGIAVAQGFGLIPVMPLMLRDLGMLLAGIVMGSAITPEMVQALGRYPASLLILAITTTAIVVAGRWSLMRIFGWNQQESLYASLPGAMSAVLAVASEMKLDMQRVAVPQAFRMFVLVALMPSVVVLSAGHEPPAAPPPVSDLGFAIVSFCAFAAALLLERLRVLSPLLLGGMAAAGLLHASGLVLGAPPVFVSDLSMFLIGVFAASRLGAITFAVVRALFLPSLILLLVTTAIAMIGALATILLVGTDTAEALVAYAPGGLEAMVIVGLALGLDPLYVASHHLARFLMIAFALPFIAHRRRAD